MIKCPICNLNIAKEDVFCSDCGHQLKTLDISKKSNLISTNDDYFNKKREKEVEEERERYKEVHGYYPLTQREKQRRKKQIFSYSSNLKSELVFFGTLLVLVLIATVFTWFNLPIELTFLLLIVLTLGILTYIVILKNRK
ncbi:MAG: zinc ribbon domain-containing protein [Candidatus Hodarchaeales archaeon]|jgi:hypothetical protein